MSISLEGNPNFNKELFDRFSDYTATIGGAAGVIWLARVVSSYANLGFYEIKRWDFKALKAIVKTADQTLLGLFFLRLPFTTQKTITTLWNLPSDKEKSLPRKVAEGAKGMLSLLSAWGAVFARVVWRPLFQLVSYRAEFWGRVVGTSLTAEQYRNLQNIKVETNTEEAIEHSKHYYFCRLIQNGMMLSQGVFLTAMVFSPTVLTGLFAQMAWALSISVLGIYTDLLKDSGRYKIIRL